MRDDTKTLMQKAAILFYEAYKSQNEIAKKLGISRSYVAKLLQMAKEQNVVKVTIHVDSEQDRDLKGEIEFEKVFPSLQQIYILNVKSDEEALARIGNFAGPIIAGLIDDAEVIGLNLGASVERAVAYVDKTEIANPQSKKLVQIMGALKNELRPAIKAPNELIRTLSNKLLCESYYLNCPAIIHNESVRKGMIDEPDIAAVMSLWKELDIAIMGIGVAGEESQLSAQLTPQMQSVLEKSGVVGELTLNYFDEEGQQISLFGENKAAISWQQLKKVKTKVVVSTGEYKARSISAALKGKMIDVLITDSLTVKRIYSLL